MKKVANDKSKFRKNGSLPDSIKVQHNITKGGRLKKIIIDVLIGCLLVILSVVPGESANTKFHPRNIELIKKGLIPPMKYFPGVPRITAEEARGLFLSNKGFFIAIGGDSKKMQGGILLHDYMKFDPRRLKVPKGKIIVTYCG